MIALAKPAALAGAWVLIALSMPSVAAAQVPDLEAARAAFEAGQTSFDAGDMEAALEHFRAAYGHAPRTNIRFNIAVCLSRLGRFREASQEYDQAARAGDLIPEDAERAREFRREARAELGTMAISGTPVGAAVFVNGERTCTLPCELEWDPGTVDVEVRGDGGESASQTVEVTAGSRTEVTLDATPGERAVAILPPSESPDPPAMPETETDASSGPSWLTWAGAGLALGGTGVAVGFGLHTRDLEADYRALPDPDLRDEGLRAQLVTNLALGLAVLGAALIGLDFVLD